MKAKKLICVLLLATMLLGALASCNNNTTSPSDTTSDIGDQITGEIGGDNFAVPESLDYDGYEFLALLTGNYRNNDFEIEDASADVVEEAKYKKNMFTEDYLDIIINYEDVMYFGSTGGSGPGYQKFNESFSAGSYDYDIGMIGAYDCATLAYSNLLFDLNELPNLNLENSWWDQNARQDLSVQGRLFFTSGDIGLTYKMVTNCILFNKEMIRENPSLKNPYELVENDNWTYDTFGQEIKKVSVDENGNGTYDSEDTFGLLAWNDPVLSMITASGEKVISANNDGELEFTLYTERADQALRKYCEILFDSQHAFNYQYGTSSAQWDPTRYAMFDEGRALYYLTCFCTIEDHRNMKTDFGVLPFPKFDENQDRYYHTDTPFHTQYACAPILIEEEERTGAILETLAYYSKQYLTPAYYEKTLVGTYFRDDESAEMLDLIFSTYCYDLGVYYNVASINNRLVAMLDTRQYTFASICAGINKTAKEQIKEINENFASFE